MEWKVDGSSRRGSMVGSERGLLWDMVVVVVWLMGVAFELSLRSDSWVV